ncbi:MAG TPA: carboxypeptidase regulatory-like domain-containing protein [Terriglobales bacterium]|nr:carboxypeptidase regulatory-like domain-containing protein [Terriglobales bacterium]
MRPLGKSAWIVVSAAAVFLACHPLLAQTNTGRILGSVTDSTGAALDGASVIVTDLERGVSRSLRSDQAGAYVAPELLPGSYKVRAEAKGFRSVERINIVLEVARDIVVDFQLQPGEVKETVVVSEEIPLLDTTSATLGGTLSNNEINDLPLSGRNYENLLQLRPGVVRYPGGGFSTTSTNGLRAEDNAYIIEGLLNSEPYSGQGIINGAGIAGDSATILPIDAIQEFNLQEHPPAEYGWKPGAVVNVGLKSGTNSIHGTAFAFGRDGRMDARNYFNCAAEPCAYTQTPSPKNGRSLEQFGGSFGGRLIKDKAFFFAAYEGQRYDVGNQFGGVTSPSMVSMPTAGNCLLLASGDCGGSIPDAIADLEAEGLTISPASLQVAGCTLGPPVSCNGKGFPTNNNPTINIVNGFPNQVTVDNVVGKVDYHLNERNTISGMYFFGNNSGTVEDFPELQDAWRSKIHTRAQVVGGSWVWTPTNRLVNEARFGYNRLYQPTLPGDLNVPASTYGLNTGVSGPYTGGLPRIGFAGYFFPGLGGFKWPKFQGPDSITQFIDHLSYTAGKHAIKFGASIHRNYVSGGAFGNARGSITFLGANTLDPTDPTHQTFLNTTPLEDFFAGTPFKISVLTGDPRRQSHNWAYSGFVQDDYRVTRTLTVNLGVRYEVNTVVSEAHNLLGNFDPTLGMVQAGKQIGSIYNPDRKDFAPRFGFAWDMNGKGNTVVRGGGGLMYETVNWQSFLAFDNSFGLPSVPTGAVIDAAGDTAGGTITTGNLTIFPDPTSPWDNGPIYGNLSNSKLNCDPVNAQPCAIMGVDRNVKAPYVWNWSLSLQHAFTPNFTLDLAYVGNHGSRLTGIRDINQQAPLGDQTTRPYNKQFPYLSNIFQMGNVYRSNYNGLQATLNSRNFHGLTMVAGYTYSHALDDVGANWDFGAGYGLPQNSNNLAAEYGNSDFDVRHRLTLSLTYAIPGTKGYGQMLEGWEINTIATLASPQYWGPIDLTTDIAGLGGLPVSPPQATPQRWNFSGNPDDFKSGPISIPYLLAGTPPASDPLGPTDPAYAMNDPACTAHAQVVQLQAFGCYKKGSSVMTPPDPGAFGSMRRNIFPDSGFKNLDFSLAKNFHFGERLRAQFRAEFFNILNHPNFANPYGGQNGYGQNDPGAPGTFGCGCATPDIAAANPAVGSGGPRSIQLGLKFIF